MKRYFVFFSDLATKLKDGIMCKEDKKKLDGIEESANNYVHPSSGVKVGTYKSITVDAQGHVTSGSNPTTLAEYGITDAANKDHSHKTVNGHTVEADVPANAQFTDTVITVDNALNKNSTNPVQNKILAEEMEALKKSAGDGKTSVAAAITAMGVQTAADASFATMAANIANISTGVDTTDATATEADMLYGKTAYIKGTKVTGTMQNQGAKTVNLNDGESYTIPAGYHNGSGKVTAMGGDPNKVTSRKVLSDSGLNFYVYECETTAKNVEITGCTLMVASGSIAVETHGINPNIGDYMVFTKSELNAISNASAYFMFLDSITDSDKVVIIFTKIFKGWIWSQSQGGATPDSYNKISFYTIGSSPLRLGDNAGYTTVQLNTIPCKGTSVHATEVIPIKDAATYTPSTSNQTIALNQYLRGSQTIKGDANLIASNIKKGVSIFGVAGNYEPADKPASPVSDHWTSVGLSSEYSSANSRYEITVTSATYGTSETGNTIGHALVAMDTFCLMKIVGYDMWFYMHGYSGGGVAGSVYYDRIIGTTNPIWSQSNPGGTIYFNDNILYSSQPFSIQINIYNRFSY